MATWFEDIEHGYVESDKGNCKFGSINLFICMYMSVSLFI